MQGVDNFVNAGADGKVDAGENRDRENTLVTVRGAIVNCCGVIGHAMFHLTASVLSSIIDPGRYGTL